VFAERPDEALRVVAERAGNTTGDITIFDTARAFVDATALTQLGRTDEAAEVIVGGVGVARLQELEYDLARLLQLAAELGHGTDARLGTDDAGAEASRLFVKLGVLTESAV
jgi:hypothetical protein